MQITWHGQYTLKITSKDDVLVIDPYSPEVGLPPFRAKATIVALSNPQEKTMSHLQGIQGEYRLINTAGEYSLSGFTLHALGWHNEANIEQNLQLWDIEEMTLLHVGAITRDLTDVELQKLEKIGVDILVIPVGGGSGLDVKGAMKLVTTIEPRLLLPIHYNLPGLKEKLEPISQFAKELGVEVKPEPKITIKAKNLPEDEMQTIILKP